MENRLSSDVRAGYCQYVRSQRGGLSEVDGPDIADRAFLMCAVLS